MEFKTVQFYVAEMVVILEYLHTRGLAHRDFKVANRGVGLQVSGEYFFPCLLVA